MNSLSMLHFFQLLMVFKTSNELCFWWKVLLMTSSLQEHLSSEPLFFRHFKLLSCWFHYSHLFFQNLCFKETLNFLSMVLHTWTNISISNWQFLILCYHQNSRVYVKHILFQHIDRGWIAVESQLRERRVDCCVVSAVCFRNCGWIARGRWFTITKRETESVQCWLRKRCESGGCQTENIKKYEGCFGLFLCKKIFFFFKVGEPWLPWASEEYRHCTQL